MRRKLVNTTNLFLHFYDYPLLNELEFPFMQEWFLPNLTEIGKMFHFRRFFPICSDKNCFSLVANPASWGPHFVQA
jgi:hypothetical protein